MSIWPLIKLGLRRVSGPLAAVVPSTRPRFHGRAVRTIEEIDEVMKQAQIARDRSPDEFAAFLETFYLDVPAPSVPPSSREYREHQMAVYRRIAGKGYDVQNERHVFDVDAHSRTPYPYTGSHRDVGQQLMAMGYVIQQMALPRGSRVLELGIGWGNLALHLARMGVHVTGLDIEPNFAEVVHRNAQRLDLRIDVRTGRFLDIEHWVDQFDAVLFYESFHHCDDHQRLLDAVRRVLKPRGKLVLAGEPIEPRLPYPWGLNCSGIALWSIRQHGWLELAFREEYLLRILAERGYRTVKYDCPVTAAGITYICERAAW